MPTIEENLRVWDREYPWADGGEEWSRVWGGSRAQWSGSILPRIRAFLPAGRALEIGCGYGRWSRHLRRWCSRLSLVDLAPSCVAACRRAFADDPGVEVCGSDGRSLSEIAPGPIDFAFSFDALVHADLEVVRAYLAELAERLAPDGAAFLHHSNFGAVLAARPGSENRHWRAEDASAEGVAAACREVGLVCARQEVVDWGGVDDCDCFSVVVRPGRRSPGETVRRRNPHFMGEAQSIGLRTELYGLPGEGGDALGGAGWGERPAGEPGRPPAGNTG
jgi:SAM-dependent methyltransferase